MTTPSPSLTVLRGGLVYLRDDPFLTDPAAALVHESDSVVICRDGVIEAVGAYDALRGRIPADAEVARYADSLIVPGFVDAHVHYVQTGMIGSAGHQLLDWLNDYAFPAELAFADRAHAEATADLFCDEMLRNGVTSALVFCSVHAHSVDALFEAAARRGMRLAAGKTMMDRLAPAGLLDTAQSSYDQSKALMDRWHGRGRALYAVTPRFAGTSTPEQLALAGALKAERPDALVHTHVSENLAEIAMVRDLFPEAAGYLDVYDRHGLVGPGAVLAHGVHLTESELCRCCEAGAAIAHCPTSNLFLGSGLFRVDRAKDPHRPVEVGLGTDIGAGPSFSMLAVAGEAYKVGQLGGYALDAAKALYLATLGGARAMGISDRVGTLAPGMEADLAVLDPAATPLLKFRNDRSRSVEETLFVLMALGDDRAVRATYVAGRLAHDRDAPRRLSPALGAARAPSDPTVARGRDPNA